MSDPEFWWNWPVQLAIAVGTIGAVLAALFGERFRAPPRLVLERRNPRGITRGASVAAPGQPPHQTVSRWYHVEVRNLRRTYAPARETQLYLVSVEVPNAVGAYVQQWAGAIPLKIRDRGVVLVGNTIGPRIEYDLCSVYRETVVGGPRLFQLHPVVPPPNVTVTTDQPYKARLTLQARSIETDLDPFRVEIVWDGQWADDSDQMIAHHLIITAPA
jgi:hypothetical protein